MGRSLWPAPRVPYGNASGRGLGLVGHLALLPRADRSHLGRLDGHEQRRQEGSNTFATGAGGGSGGTKAKEFKTKAVPKNIKSLAKTNTRITSKNANATLAVASLPSLSNPLLSAGAIGGGSSKGFGGGTGGGIGSGKGLGVGGGRNFVSLFGGRGGAGTALLGQFWDIKRPKDPNMPP